MANITQWASSGFHSMQAAKRMAGIFGGFSGLTTANTGTASNSRLMIGGVTAPTPLPQSNRVYNRGRDGYIKSTIFDSQPNQFTIAAEDFDGDVSAVLNNETVFTVGEWDIVPEGGPVNFQDMMWLFSRHAASKEAASDGSEGYENLLVLSSSGRYEAGDMNFQAAGAFNIQAVASPSQKTMFGTTALASHGKLTIYTERWFSDYPCSMVCFVGDGTITAVPLAYTPVTVAKTKFYRTDTGVALTTSSVSVGGKTATLSAAPASGLITVGVYETTDI